MDSPNQPPRLPLARLPVPIEPLPRLSHQTGRRLWVLRDDLTGFALSGNKVRKLEYLVADAVAAGATHLVTCGGPQSNHARATALVARQLGLGVSIVVREAPGGPLPGPWTGNVLLARLLAAEIMTVTHDEFEDSGSTYEPFLARCAEVVSADGGLPYVVPEGGSNALGCWGYVQAAAELAEAWRGLGTDTTFPDRVYCAIGSGGTYAGLRLGIDRLDVSASVHGVNVTRDAAFFTDVITGLTTSAADRYGLPLSDEPVRIVDGFVGGGYAVATDGDLRFYRDVAVSEGLLLDPVYTGKAFRGMLADLRDTETDPGDHILFVHTGGGFGTFAFGAQFERALSHGPGGAIPAAAARAGGTPDRDD